MLKPKSQFIKSLATGNLYKIENCTFFLDFKQVVVESDCEPSYILNEGEFEIIEQDATSYKLSYEENTKRLRKHYEIVSKVNSDFRSEHLEPDDYLSDEHQEWDILLTQVLMKNLNEHGFNDIKFKFE